MAELRLSSLNGFDRIAGVYDSLASVFFLGAIKHSQQHFLSSLNNDARILVLGGGSGWIIRDLFEVSPAFQVWYIEASAEMIKRARSNGNSSVHFIHGTEKDIPSGIVFDAVITNFYLDLFSVETIAPVILAIRASLHTNAVWLATDFVNRTWWHKLLLKIMYRFFRLAASIESSELVNWVNRLEDAGFRLKGSHSYYGGFILATRFCREG